MGRPTRKISKFTLVSLMFLSNIFQNFRQKQKLVFLLNIVSKFYFFSLNFFSHFYNFIFQIPIKGEQCQYDASYYDPHMALDYGGYSFDYSERFHGGTIPPSGGNDELEEGKYQLRLLIPTKSAGVIIGKGGETIKSISHKVGSLDGNFW